MTTLEKTLYFGTAPRQTVRDISTANRSRHALIYHRPSAERRHYSVALVYALLFLWCPVSASALTSDSRLARIAPTQFEAEEIDIVVDGRLDEATWAELPAHDEYLIIEPDTLDDPEYRTELRFAYTARGLYVGVMSFQPHDTLVARISQRDQRINRDEVSITIDPTGEGLYGYWFSVSLGGLCSTVRLCRNATFQISGTGRGPVPRRLWRVAGAQNSSCPGR